MFENDYQGGSSFEILSGSSTLLGKKWKMSRLVSRLYTADIKGYSYLVNNGKLTLPSDNNFMSLYQPFILFQAHLISGSNLSVEFATQDLLDQTKRIFLSTAIKEIKMTPLHAALPLTLPNNTGWVNLCFDIPSLLHKFFPGANFKSIVGISLHGSLRLRKIATLKSRPSANPQIFSDQNYFQIPKSLDFPSHIPNSIVLIDYCQLQEMKSSPKNAVAKTPTTAKTAFGRSLPKSLSKVKEMGFGSCDSLTSGILKKGAKLVSSAVGPDELPPRNTTPTYQTEKEKLKDDNALNNDPACFGDETEIEVPHDPFLEVNQECKIDIGNFEISEKELPIVENTNDEDFQSISQSSEFNESKNPKPTSAVTLSNFESLDIITPIQQDFEEIRFYKKAVKEDDEK